MLIRNRKTLSVPINVFINVLIKSIAIGFFILWIFLLIWGIHGYVTSTYYNAKRARSAGDVVMATELFEKAVREDTRSSSFDALLALMKMEEPQSLFHLIELIDVPEMNYIEVDARIMMCDVIRKRTNGTTADSLPLDPNASQESRAEQKRQWQAWLAEAKEQYNWENGRFVPK